MNCSKLVLLTILLTAPASAIEIRGRVTDESQALVPGAKVIIAGPAKRTTVSNSQGEYRFPDLPPGRYTVTATAPQLTLPPLTFSLATEPLTLNLVLKISLGTQTLNVDGAANAVVADTRNNPAALVLRGDDLEALSDKPEDLAADLMALAGPSAGPNGGAIFVDGFSGGNLPSKDSIREIRINQNPFAPENDRVGYGTIEIFTKPGSDQFKGALYYNFADASLNTRNPYAARKAPFRLHEYGGNFGGPLGKQSSFFVDLRRDDIDNGAVINGTVIDRNGTIVNPYTDVLRIPQQRLSISPRADWQLGQSHTLTARYTFLEAGVDNSGVGSFNLPERGLEARGTAHTAQLTDTWIVNARAINETRFQFFRLASSNRPYAAGPAIQVLGAFNGGGAPLGNSSDTRHSFELQNYTSLNRGLHTVRFGLRVRGEFADTHTLNNFNGTFTFGGSSSGVSSIEQYRRTLLGLAGGGATQFTLTAGQPGLAKNQVDAGLFAGDDWRARPNLTVSYGLRYERQTNLSDRANLAPRFAFAWAPGQGKTNAKGVLRAATGLFYDRFGLANTINATRYDGQIQQQYVIANPDFFPRLPTPAQLAAARTAQIIQRLNPSLRALRLWQSAAGYDRELRQGTTLSLTYAFARGEHLLRSRALPGPVFEAQSTGIYRQHQWIASLNSRLNSKVSVFGSYVLNRARGNTDGIGTFPANPFTDVGEYGPAATDIRQRANIGGTLVAWKGLRLNPLFTAETGPPFDITVGRDLYGTTLFNGRPALATDPAKLGVIATNRYGLLDPNPAANHPTIGRNYGRGPGSILLNLRLSRTFAFGLGEGREAPTNIPGGGERRAGDAGVFAPGTGVAAGGARTSRKYNVTIGLSIRNLLNHTNPGPLIGNLTSPLFGQANQPAGAAVPTGTTFSESANNRRLELQMRFTF